MGNKIDLLYEKKDRIAAGGGEKRIAKQHDSGKLTARERQGSLPAERPRSIQQACPAS